MSNVVRLSGKRRSAPPDTQIGKRDFQPGSLSGLVRTVLHGQEIARRGAIIALFDLDRVLANCREAIAQIPAGDTPERRRLDQDLIAIERAIRDARILANAL